MIPHCDIFLFTVAQEFNYYKIDHFYVFDMPE